MPYQKKYKTKHSNIAGKGNFRTSGKEMENGSGLSVLTVDTENMEG